jgi:hypothetical protein
VNEYLYVFVDSSLIDSSLHFLVDDYLCDSSLIDFLAYHLCDSWHFTQRLIGIISAILMINPNALFGILTAIYIYSDCILIYSNNDFNILTTNLPML